MAGGIGEGARDRRGHPGKMRCRCKSLRPHHARRSGSAVVVRGPGGEQRFRTDARRRRARPPCDRALRFEFAAFYSAAFGPCLCGQASGSLQSVLPAHLPAQALRLYDETRADPGAPRNSPPFPDVITEIYPTAQDAEHAFYQAFERADLASMMAVWAEEDDIVCVHPGGARRTGV